MGADGGSIPRRDDLVKEKKKPEKKDKVAEMKHKWNNCAVSQLSLQKPIMACELGNLYNKESVLEMLLDKQKMENFSHIKGLKDIKELKVHNNPALERKDNKMDTTESSLYVCPVTGLEMNGKHKFIFLWNCGCVMSERAIKEVPSANCHKCGSPFTSNDVVVLNGDEKDVELMKTRMHDRRSSAKLAKKHKKEADNSLEPKTKSAKVDKTREKEVKDQSKSKAKSEKKSTSVQNDPSTSQVFKSLFTSSTEAKSQPKQHPGWVTFNPQYFR